MVVMVFAISLKPKRHRFRRSSGFTLAEVIFAGCILAVFICGSVSALAQINRWATRARLQTLALAVAQQKIDLLQTTGWQITGAPPAVLTAGTSTETNLPLNNDAFNSETGLSSAFTSLDYQVNATRTTQITSLSASTLRAVVTVTFTYRNRTSSVSLTTLRATDSI